MSAFMVADTTINNVLNWLWDENIRLSLIPRKLKELGFDISKAGWEENLGQAMFQLNISGVETRYGKGEAARFRDLDYQYRMSRSVPLVQVLKSLQCWLYQCCEGDVPETELYKLFDTVVRLYLMGAIIERLPEYEEAVW